MFDITFVWAGSFRIPLCDKSPDLTGPLQDTYIKALKTSPSLSYGFHEKCIDLLAEMGAVLGRRCDDPSSHISDVGKDSIVENGSIFLSVVHRMTQTMDEDNKKNPWNA